MINFNRMLIDWDEETATMESIGGPLVPDDAAVSIDVDAMIPTPNVVNEFELMDVTDAVRDWLGGQENFGWLLSQDTTSGYDVRSSEWVIQEERPSLTIDFTPPDRDPDFNGDGAVDNADFVILRENMYAHLDGTNVTFTTGDLNFDQQVNLLDFRIFKAEFPGALGAGAGVPEPSTIGLVLVALCGIFLARRRRRTA
jgi:hypothetical protein